MQHLSDKVSEEFQGQLAHLHNIQTGRLWDSLEWAKGSTVQLAKFFTNSDSNRPPTDTNVYGGRLDAPETFCIKRLAVTFSKNCDPRDVVEFTEQLTLELWLGMKYFVRCPIAHMVSVKQPLSPIKICDFCRSVYVQTSGCPGCGAKHFTLSSLGDIDPGQQYAMDLHPSIVIMCQQRFYVALQGDSFGLRDRLKVWVHLEGLHAYGVQ